MAKEEKPSRFTGEMEVVGHEEVTNEEIKEQNKLEEAAKKLRGEE